MLVVVGPAAERDRAALNDLEVEIVPAADFEKGLSHSLRAGLASVPQEDDGAAVLLTDMPPVSPTIDHLMNSFAAAEQPSAVVPVYRNRRGNPVVLGRKLSPQPQHSKAMSARAQFSAPMQFYASSMTKL